jgi:deazaflavin-dependent oxidoreductase (nitroreductase family)
MNMQRLLNSFANPFMKMILRSPLHGLMSASVVLITVTGRKSGKRYTTPTNYWRDGNALTIVSFKDRTWWRNLRGGAPVTVRLQGRDVQGRGVAIEDSTQVASALMPCLAKTPQYARYLGVALDAEGKPRSEDVARAAQTRVVVQVKLN